MKNSSCFGAALISLLHAVSVLAQSDAIKPDDIEACAACGACGLMGSFIFVIPIAVLVLHIFILVWVARDAKARDADNIALWLVLVVFAGIIGLIVYLLSRPQGNLVQCQHCQNKRLQASARCPHCGNA